MNQSISESRLTGTLPPPIDRLPANFRRNLERAIKLLQDGGCTEVYLFGSLVTSRLHEQSDIDLAVRGCPQGEFFHLLGLLMMQIDYPVDLIDLDSADAFAHFLVSRGKLLIDKPK